MATYLTMPLRSDVSEGQREETNQKRIKVMNQNNPRFILRNYLAQKAVEQAGAAALPYNCTEIGSTTTLMCREWQLYRSRTTSFPCPVLSLQRPRSSHPTHGQTDLT